MSPALAGGFLTTALPGKSPVSSSLEPVKKETLSPSCSSFDTNSTKFSARPGRCLTNVSSFQFT